MEIESPTLKNNSGVRENALIASLSGLGGLLFLKPLIDMFWSISLLDYFLLAYAVILLLMGLVKKETRFCFVDCLVVSIMFLILLCLLRSEGGFQLAVKMLSAFLLYFLGRIYWDDLSIARNLMMKSFSIVIIVNLLLLIAGQGFTLWGHANTFTGMYFFKTDLSCAMGTAFALFLLFAKDKRIKAVMCLLAAIMVILSNTRAYYVILLLALICYLGMKLGKRVTGRTILLLLIGIVLILYFLNWLFSTGLFASLGFITFQFDNLADLFNASNTQGRDTIWRILMDQFASAPLIEKLFGISLVGDQVYVNNAVYTSHSLYIGTLYNIGIIGVLLMTMFFIYIYRSIGEIDDERTSYFILMLFLQFLLSGLSVDTLQFTANSWIAFAMFGIAISLSRKNKKEVPHMQLRGI